jgi:polyisoprenoid-binding protein YceI
VIPLGLMMLVCSWALLSSAMAGSEPPVRFRIDPAASLVWFDADARLHSFRGQTHTIDGYFTLQSSAPPQIAKAKVIIEAASLETGNSDRDADMRNDFLEVRRFPTIEFSVTELLTPRSIAGGAEWDLVLQGQLMVHGITRDVKVPATISLGSDRVTARGQIRLDIRDYHIRVPRLLLIPMKSEVLVGFAVVAQPAM